MLFFRAQLVFWCICYFSAVEATDIYSKNPNQILENSKQLIIVRTEDWNSFKGSLVCFEKNHEGEWIQHDKEIPVVVGKNGMAWGKGLHNLSMEEDGPIKTEGDLKAPAGMFSLGSAFGHTNKQYMSELKMPYIEIAPLTEAIDDPDSRYYNYIVDTRLIKNIDWKTSEKMGLISLYLRGVVINHNMQNINPEFGSQIFMHIWGGPQCGTAGCTAMKEEYMEKILFWLDSSKNPLLIQLPKAIEHRYFEIWGVDKLLSNACF